MKKSFQSPYFKWGLTAFVVIIACICFFFSIFKMQGLFLAIQNFIGILKPFIYGAVVAYFMLPVYNLLVRKLHPAMRRIFKKNSKRASGWTKMISSIASVFLLLALISTLLSMVLPQLATSIFSLTNAMEYMNEIPAWLDNFLKDSPGIRDNLLHLYGQFSDWIVN